MNVLRALQSAVLSLAVLLPAAAHAAWWNAEYKQRAKITLNTSAAGVETKEALSGTVVPVRLHTGNFDFLEAKADGADLRVVASDDKTPLKFVVERYDSVNEMAVLWVQVPSVMPGSDKNVVYVYAGNEAAAAESAGAGAFDSATLAAFHFSEKDGVAADHTGSLKSASPFVPVANGMIGASAKLAGEPLTWAASDKLRASNAGPYTVSLWARPEAAAEGTLFAQGPLKLSLKGAKAVAEFGAAKVEGGEVPPAAWAHLGLSIGSGKLTLYVNGVQAAQADLPQGAPAIEGALSVGQGYTGQLDELQVAASVRSADWMKFTRAAQGADAKLIASVKQAEDSAEGEEEGHGGYMGILVGNLTVDAWVVIGILAVMFVIAAWVMVTKALFVGRTDRDNRSFQERFRESHDVLQVAQVDQIKKQRAFGSSSLARLYAAGLHELQKRDVGKSGGAPLSGASLDAVKAAIDAESVRESHELNSKMVLLTIAISGGPFLGLLGTVVGVMITFAAIAAAGDVNVNAIAPGIAAALLATVAGLGVAIPALFGYNYLAARIKNISSDMQIFIDEFVTRVAESYGAR